MKTFILLVIMFYNSSKFRTTVKDGNKLNLLYN